MKTLSKKIILPISLMASAVATVMVVNIAQSEYKLNPDSNPVVLSSITANPRTIDEDTVSLAKIEQLRKELALERSLVKRKQQRIADYQDQLAEINNETDNVDDSADTLEFDETEDQAWADENMAIMDIALNKEKADPEWSTMATANINEVLSSDGFEGTELVSTECGSSFCRIETRFQNESNTDQFLNEFGFQISWSGSAFAKIINHEAGGQTIVYYLSREGHDLPHAEG